MAGGEALKGEVDALLQRAKNRQAALQALALLFPKLGASFDIPTGYVETPGRLPRRRISSADFSRAYFNLTPDDIVWAKSQADALASGDPNDAFESYRARIARTSPRDQARLRRVFIDLLSSISEQGQRQIDWFMAILENAGVLLNPVQETKLGLFDLEIETQINFLLANILTPLNEDNRYELISHAIANAADLSFLCGVFRSFAGDVEPSGAKGRSDRAFGEKTETLRRVLVDRVENAAQSRELYEQVRPQDLLWFWWGSGHGQEVRRHTAEAIEDRRALRSLLQISIDTVRSTAGNYERVDRRAWSKIVDLEELRRRAEIVSKDPSDPDFEVSRRFLVALSRDNKDEF